MRRSMCYTKCRYLKELRCAWRKRRWEWERFVWSLFTITPYSHTTIMSVVEMEGET